MQHQLNVPHRLINPQQVLLSVNGAHQESTALVDLKLRIVPLVTIALRDLMSQLLTSVQHKQRWVVSAQFSITAQKALHSHSSVLMVKFKERLVDHSVTSAHRATCARPVHKLSAQSTRFAFNPRLSNIPLQRHAPVVTT